LGYDHAVHIDNMRGNEEATDPAMMMFNMKFDGLYFLATKRIF
jgi:hypothetical protein